MIGPYPYNQGNQPPYFNPYIGYQPWGMAPGAYPYTRMPASQDFYLRQPFSPQAVSVQKPQTWYITAGQEALKIGAIVGASVLGGIFLGPAGALGAGAVTSGAISAIGQNAARKKIDWGTVAIDTALGAIPGGVGSTLLKTGQHWLGKELVKTGVRKAAVIGSMDGALMGYAGGASHSAYDHYQKTGRLNLSQANRSGLRSILPGLLGGAIAGGAFTALGNRLSKSSSEPSKPKPPAQPESHLIELSSQPKAEIAKTKEAASISVPENEVRPALPDTQTPRDITTGTLSETPKQKSHPTIDTQPSLTSHTIETHSTKPLTVLAPSITTEIAPKPASAPIDQPLNIESRPSREVPPAPPPRPKRQQLPSTSTQTDSQPPLQAATLPKPPALPPRKPVVQLRDTGATPSSHQAKAQPTQTPSQTTDAPTPQRVTTRPALTSFQPLFKPDANLTPINFQQGGMLDCFLLSAIHAATQHPNGAKLLSRIQARPLPDGNYQVEFPGMPGQPVTVTQASLTTPPGIIAGPPEIRILEQAYKAMMTHKARQGEIAPLNGRELLRHMFGDEQTTTLLQRYNPTNRNTQTLIQDVFNVSISPEEMTSLDVPACRGNSPQEVHNYQDALSLLLQTNEPLRQKFQAMPITPAGNHLEVTLPNGDPVRLTAQNFTSIQNPEEQQLAIKMQAILKQYEPQFMNGKPVTHFDEFMLHVLSQPGGDALLLEKIKMNHTATGTEVVFPKHPTNPNVTRKIQLQDQHFANMEEDRLRIIAEAARALEFQTRVDGTMNVGQPEQALRNMFGDRLINTEVHNIQASNLQPLLRENVLFTAVARPEIENHPYTKEHVYSVQPNGSDPNTIVVTDPMNTQTKRHRIPVEEFLRLFDVRGVRFQINN